MSTPILRVQEPTDTKAGWASANPTPLAGERCYESDTQRWKVGDGSTPWNSLPYGDANLVKVIEGPLSLMDERLGAVQDASMSSAADNATALNAAYTMLASSGGEIFVPKGVYPFRSAPNPQPSGVWLIGEGYDYSTATTPRPQRGSVFRALASMAHLVRLGNATGLGPGVPAASMRGMSLDGNNLADATLKAMTSRSRISHCQVYSGVSQAYYCAGQNVHVDHSIFAQDDTGDVITVAAGSSVIDNKIWTSQIRSPGSTGASVRIRSNAVDVQECHLWAGGGGAAKPAQALIVLEAQDANGLNLALITDNTIEGVYGPEILFDATLGPIFATGVVGNKFYMNSGTADITYPVIALKGATHSALSVVGNFANGIDATHRYKSWFDFDSSVSSLGGLVVTGNTGRFVAALHSGTIPPAAANIGYGVNQIHDGTSWKRTTNRGQATFTGDGSATTFTIAHGLLAAPQEVTITAGSPAAAAYLYETHDATNIQVTFTTAPANGATVKLNWRADL